MHNEIATKHTNSTQKAHKIANRINGFIVDLDESLLTDIHKFNVLALFIYLLDVHCHHWSRMTIASHENTAIVL